MAPGGRTCVLVDTAGMRRVGAWGTVATPLEGPAVGLAKRALAMAHVVALVVDGAGGDPAGLALQPRRRPVSTTATGRAVDALATLPPPSSSSPPPPPLHINGGTATGWALTKADLAIAEQVLTEGRALLVLVNKVDALADTAAVVATARRQVDAMSGAVGVPVLPVSALTGGGCAAVLPAALRTYDKWNARVSTARLNAWLRSVVRHHPPPAVTVGAPSASSSSGRRVSVKLKYATQIGSRPPTFAVFANTATVPESYKRFVSNRVRDEFELEGVPVRVLWRSATNPFRGGERSGVGEHARRRSLRVRWGGRAAALGGSSSSDNSSSAGGISGGGVGVVGTRGSGLSRSDASGGDRGFSGGSRGRGSSIRSSSAKPRATRSSTASDPPRSAPLRGASAGAPGGRRAAQGRRASGSSSSAPARNARGGARGASRTSVRASSTSSSSGSSAERRHRAQAPRAWA